MPKEMKEWLWRKTRIRGTSLASEIRGIILVHMEREQRRERNQLEDQRERGRNE